MPGHLVDHEAERVSGVALAFLITRMNEWIHRRVDCVKFLDDVTFQRHVSIDFTFPASEGPIARSISESRDGLLVPLALLSKEHGLLSDFSLRDESAQALPMLSRVQNEAVAAGCLVALGRTVNLSNATDKAAAADLPDAVIDAFRFLSAEPTQNARALLRVIRALAEPFAPDNERREEVFGSEWTALRLRKQDRVTPAVKKIADGLKPHGALLWSLFSQQMLNLLSRSLGSQFLLLTPLSQAEAMSGFRRVFKFSYNDSTRAPARGIVKDTVDWMLEALGVRPADYTIHTPPIARAASYHLEIPAPPSVQITRAELFSIRAHPAPPAEQLPWSEEDAAIPRAIKGICRALRTGQPARFRAPIPRAIAGAVIAVRPPRRPEPIIDRIDRCIAGPSNSSASLQLDARSGSSGRAEVSFQPTGVGLLRTGTFLAIGITAVLFVLKGKLSEIESKEAAGALLLLVPALVVGMLAGPGEHAIATRSLLGIRLMVGLSGIASFVAAAALVAWKIHAQHVIWTAAAWVALAAAIFLLLNLSINWRRAPRKGNVVPLRRYTWQRNEAP